MHTQLETQCVSKGLRVDRAGLIRSCSPHTLLLLPLLLLLLLLQYITLGCGCKPTPAGMISSRLCKW
jgi:hypothetical protein